MSKPQYTRVARSSCERAGVIGGCLGSTGSLGSVTKCDKSHRWLHGGGCLASGRGRSAVFKLGDSHEERRPPVWCQRTRRKVRWGHGYCNDVKKNVFLIARATEKGGTQTVSGVLRSCHRRSSNGP